MSDRTKETVNVGSATLYRGRCEEILHSIQFDAICTDPPYGHGWSGVNSKSAGGGNWRKRRAEKIVGHDTPFDPSALLTFKVPTILWGANHYAHLLPPRPSWLAWDKREGTSENNLSDCELAWCSVGGSARLFHHLWNGLSMKSGSEETKRSGNGGAMPRLHPLQKPVALMRWCIQQLDLKPGATIADPYMGCGTTGVAAHDLGHPFIGIEIDEVYFSTAVERLEAAHKQQRLFA